MSRKSLYPEGSTTMHVVVSRPVKGSIDRAASRQRQSTSQLVNAILEDYLLRRGELREEESVSA